MSEKWPLATNLPDVRNGKEQKRRASSTLRLEVAENSACMLLSKESDHTNVMIQSACLSGTLQRINKFLDVRRRQCAHYKTRETDYKLWLEVGDWL